MDKEKLAPHVEEVARALTTEMSNEEIEKELLEYVDTYGIPLDQAKRSLVAKYGGELSNVRSGTKLEIQNIIGDERSIDLTARVLAATRRTITVKGADKEITSGILGDNTATIPFTAWDSNMQIEKGDTIEVKNAYAKVFRDEPQINFGDRTGVKQVDKDTLPPYQPKLVERKIGDLRIGERNVTVNVRILDLEERDITTQDGRDKTMYTGTIADETGRIPFTAWHDFGIDEGDGITIKNSYVKRWRGSPQLVFDENSEVASNDDVPDDDDLAQVEVVTMDDISRRGGGIDVVVEGTVVDVRKGSGIIARCPECKRVTEDGYCKLHGEVDGGVAHGGVSRVNCYVIPP